MAVKAVCFDLGGVLVRITFTWHGAAKAAGVGILSEIPDEALLTTLPEFLHYQGGTLEYEQYCSALSGYLGTSIEDAGRIHRHIVVEPYHGTLELVNRLNAKGLITGCLSNTNEPHWREMLDSGRFPAVEALQVQVASHEVGAQKPEKKIFDHFLQRSGTKAEETLLFDDTKNNLEAAAGYGWLTWHIDPANETSTQIEAGLKHFGVFPS